MAEQLSFPSPEAMSDLSDDVAPALSVVIELSEDINEAHSDSELKRALIFYPFGKTAVSNPDSVARIAFTPNYRDYVKGAAANVVNSPKYISKPHGEMSLGKDSIGRVAKEVSKGINTAKAKARQRITEIIVDNYKRTDLSLLPEGHFALRLKESERYGRDAAIVFAREALGDNQRRRQLLEFAQAIDKKLSGQLSKSGGEATALAAVMETLIDQQVRSLTQRKAPVIRPEEAKFVYTLAKLWRINAVKQHRVWKRALERFNKDFPNYQIDPYDPRHFRHKLPGN